MAFRDDQEAALARAAALDQEVKRLEEENAKLRAAADARERAEREADERRAAHDRDAKRAIASPGARSTPARSAESIEQLAARARPAPRRRRDAASGDDDKRQHALRLAFTPLWIDAAFIVSVLAMATATYLVAANWLVAIGLPFPPLVIVFMLPGIGLAVWLYHRIAIRCVQRTKRWVHRLPFSIDPDRYLHRMAAVFEDRLVVHVELAEVGTEAALLERAVIGGMPGATATLDGRTLRIASPKLKVHYSARGSSVAHNGKPHRWFRKLVRRVLVPIGHSHRIVEVRFQ